MKRFNLYLSSIGTNVCACAKEHSLGIELAQFCTAARMDAASDVCPGEAPVEACLAATENRILHAPFNELFPCAIDPKARRLAAARYRQAIELAQRLEAGKVVIHSGYAPMFYYDCWFEEQSALFWREFLETLPKGIEICLENVLETQPEPLLHVLQAIEDPRLRVCLDVGHTHCYSRRPAEEWLRV